MDEVLFRAYDVLVQFGLLPYLIAVVIVMAVVRVIEILRGAK
jgi:Flp pilus assembly pilin Flp